jgi:hypothetical protein
MFQKINIYIWNLTHPFFKRGIFLSSSSTVRQLNDNNLSLIRWGDGETNLVLGKSIYFQDFNILLQDRLRKVLINSANNRILFCVPHNFLTKNVFTLLFSKKNRLWLYSRYLLYPYLKSGTKYGDAFLFRPESSITNNELNILWKGKVVILVGSNVNDFDRFNHKNDFIASKYVNISDNNAFSNYESLIKTLLYYCSEYDLVNLRVLVSAGPTAKLLVYDLTMHGIIAYDVGHYFKWKLNDIEKKDG